MLAERDVGTCWVETCCIVQLHSPKTILEGANKDEKKFYRLSMNMCRRTSMNPESVLLLFFSLCRFDLAHNRWRKIYNPSSTTFTDCFSAFTFVTCHMYYVKQIFCHLWLFLLQEALFNFLKSQAPMQIMFKCFTFRCRRLLQDQDGIT